MRHFPYVLIFAFVGLSLTYSGKANEIDPARSKFLEDKFAHIQTAHIREQRFYCDVYQRLLKRSATERMVKLEELCKQLRDYNVLEKGPRHVVQHR